MRRARRPLHPARSRRRSHPLAPSSCPLGRNIHASTRSACPRPSRSPKVRTRPIFSSRPMPPCPAQSRWCSGGHNIKVRRRTDRPGAGPHGREAPVRQFRPAFGRRPHSPRRAGPAPDRRGDDARRASSRDLLPCRPRMLAEAAWKAATPKSPPRPNFHPRPFAGLSPGAGRRHRDRRPARLLERRRGLRLERQRSSSTRSAFAEEDELADAYEARKSFAYGRRRQGGEAVRSPAEGAERRRPRLPEPRIGRTGRDHGSTTTSTPWAASPAR